VSFLDIKAELKNFKPINIDEIVKGNEKLSDNIKNSLFLYNKAIESLKSGSEDIAAIELKKATSMNPDFYEAWNLLGLCYVYIGEKEKAAEAFGKVIKAESNSILALNYMKRLGLAEPGPLEKDKRASQAVQASEPIKRVRENKSEQKIKKDKNKRLLYTAIKIGAGFAAGFLVSYAIFLNVPQKNNEPENQPDNNTESIVNAVKDEYEAKLKELQDKYDLLQKDKDAAMQQADYYKASLKLYEIEDLAREKKYEDAAGMLFLMKTIDFKDEEKKKFDELYKQIMPQAAKAAYDQGYKLYNSKQYQESLAKFEKVQLYDPEFNRMDAVLYYMGRCYQTLHDSRSALALFQKLVDTYPASYYANSAKARIKELTQIP